MKLIGTLETEFGIEIEVQKELTDREVRCIAEDMAIKLLNLDEQYCDSKFDEDYVELFADFLLDIEGVWDQEYDVSNGEAPRFNDFDVDEAFEKFQASSRHADLKRQERKARIEQFLKDGLDEIANKAASDPKILKQLKIWANEA